MELTKETKQNYTGIGTHKTSVDTDHFNDRTYLGDYVDGKEHGIGMYVSRNGKHKYAGQFNENKAEGIGVKLYVNEDGTLAEDGRYCGEYKNNKRHGLGYWNSSGATFIGEFKDRSPNGFGIMITWEGLKFIGTVSNFLAVKGRWYNQKDEEINITELGYNADGSKFTGEVKDNIGNGTLIYPDGRMMIGEFKYQINKWVIIKGTCEWSDGRTYDGEWKNKRVNGYGIMIFPDGSKYEGKFKEGKFHGQGTIKYQNATYVGEFENGKRNGQGTETFTNGIWEGLFKDDVFIGK